MRRVLLAFVSTVAGLVMLLSFKTHSQSTAPLATVPSTGSSGTSTGSGTSSGSTGSSGTTGSTSTSRTVTGAAADTRYGPVQVQVTVRNGKVTAVQAVAYPMNDSRDQEINSYAIPQLNQEAVAAGSAQIDMVSGATYTSTGYLSSLQSALNKAGLA